MHVRSLATRASGSLMGSLAGSLAVALLGGALGCAPRVATLVQHKHYREAICAAHDGGEARRRLVSEALAADTELYLHVERIDAAELEPILGDPATVQAVLERVHLVRITARTNTLPIDDLGLWLEIHGDEMGAAGAPIGWETLAVATGERPPGPHQYETYATVGNALRILGAVVTVGVSLRFTRFGKRTVTMAAPPQEYASRMPIAAALVQALPAPYCEGAGLSARDGEAGLSCHGTFVLDRSPSARWTLTFSQTFVVDGDAQCSHRRVSRVEIGRTDEWSTVFGPRMRRLDELPGAVVDATWDRRDAPGR